MSEGTAEPIRFSTDELPPRDRLAILQEQFGPHMAKINYQSLPGHAPSLTMTVRTFPGVSLTASQSSGLYGGIVVDGSDDVCLGMNTGANGLAFVSQFGRDETLVGFRAGVLFSHSDAGYMHTPTLTHASFVRLPRNTISAAVGGLEDMFGRPFPPSEALHLLASYCAALGDQTMTSPEVRQAVGMHIQDLVSLALGAGTDQRQVATRRGLAAARLVEARKLIAQRLTEPDLTPTKVARAMAISVRQLHLLFEPTGITFSQHLMRSRIALSRRILLAPDSRHRTIADIAFACGFHNLTTFYSSFRQAFDATPDELRRNRHRP
ncbi:AraC family transcriptional regulator [Mesorhizobium sp. WSM4313]|uniref:AraC family transcriptional regulator n=1 Tax=Mesorhizobium sp. WSM4313 TaxID=2029412 RepID=UPI0015964454|nr:AraC family transcriptional regulator [Mesorhizobium sp. WSM4313]